MKQAAVFAVTGVLAGSLAGVAQQAAPQPAVPYTYQGTVHSEQAKTGTLELITGVWHALQLVQISVPTGVRVAGTAAAGTSGGVRGVQPGDVVRVVRHHTVARPVAAKAEMLETARSAAPGP